MLFKISNELLSADVIKNDNEFLIRGVENILRTVWESKHLVIADYKIIIKLNEIINNRDCNNVLISLKNNYSFLNYSAIKTYINVVPGRKILNLTEDNNYSIINISIDHFQTSDILQKTRILCEDIKDASFFEEISRFFVNKNSLGNISLKYEAEHGGGNLISVTFEKHVQSKKQLCLAFCDTDKKYPEDNIGETLKKLRQIDTSNNPLCKYIELDSHEIENLIPFNYIDDIKERHHNQRGIDFIKKIYKSDKSECLRYYDIKKGISKKQIAHNEDFYNFMLNLWPFCNNSFDLKDLENLEDETKIIPHTGKIINSLMKKKELFQIKVPKLLKYQENEWDKIGKYFFYWTCARNEETLNL